MILYAYANHELVAGSRIIWSDTPGVIEYGGTKSVVIGRGSMARRVTMKWAPRPAMRLALDIALEKVLPKLLLKSEISDGGTAVEVA